MSSILSPSLPPIAGSGLVDIIDDLTKFNNEPFKLGLLDVIKVSGLVIVLDCTLEFKPPPTKYVTVIVVLAGACP